MDLVADDDDGTPFYICRRFPPGFASPDPDGPQISAWPSVDPSHWCGEWKHSTGQTEA